MSALNNIQTDSNLFFFSKLLLTKFNTQQRDIILIKLFSLSMKRVSSRLRTFDYYAQHFYTNLNFLIGFFFLSFIVKQLIRKEIFNFRLLQWLFAYFIHLWCSFEKKWDWKKRHNKFAYAKNFEQSLQRSRSHVNENPMNSLKNRWNHWIYQMNL